MLKSSLILLLVMLLQFGMATAQEYRWEIGMNTGLNSYLGDANPKNPFLALGSQTSFLVRYNYNFRLAFSSELSYFFVKGATKNNPDNKFPKDYSGAFLTHGFLSTICSEYNFYPYSDKFPFLQTKTFTPYILGGVVVGFSSQGKNRLAFLPGLKLGLGIKWKIKNRLNLFAKLEGTHFFSDALDTSTPSSKFLNNPYQTKSSFIKGGDGMASLSVGFSYDFSVRGTTCNKNEQINR